MPRILVVLSGPITAEAVRIRFSRLAFPSEDSIAVCYELTTGANDLTAALRAQRTLTSALRVVHGDAAERMPVFVFADRDGERVEDIAREWGATEVVT